MDVLPTFALYGTDKMSTERVAAAEEAWKHRLNHLFDEQPIPFRPQNGGDFPDRHVMADDVAPGVTGLLAHIADGQRSKAAGTEVVEPAE